MPALTLGVAAVLKGTPTPFIAALLCAGHLGMGFKR